MPGINSHYSWGSNCLWYFISRKDSEDNLRPGAPNLTKKKRRECLELIAQNFPISTPSLPHLPLCLPHWKWKSQKQEKNVLINKLNVCENWKDFPCSVFSSRDPELLLASSCLFVVVVVGAFILGLSFAGHAHFVCKWFMPKSAWQPGKTGLDCASPESSRVIPYSSTPTSSPPPLPCYPIANERPTLRSPTMAEWVTGGWGIRRCCAKLFKIFT